MGTENEMEYTYGTFLKGFEKTNKFRVFQTETMVKGHFLLSSDGILYRTILGFTFKVKHPERYEVRFIAEQVD